MQHKEKLQLAIFLSIMHGRSKIFQQSDSQLFYEQHTLLMVVIPQKETRNHLNKNIGSKS